MNDKRAEQLKIDFGVRLRQLRKAKKLSMRKLALAAEVDHSQIRKMESGEVAPHLPTLSKLAEGLELTMSQLLEGL